MKTIWDLFIDNAAFTYLVIAAIAIGGLFSVITLPKEASPEVKVPIGIVTTVYPGASARDVERLITDKVEAKIASLDELDTYSSVSREGLSSITVQFEASADLDDRIRALRDAVAEAEPELPDEVERPVVQQVSFSDVPIVSFSITASVPEAELKAMAERFQEELEKISGVSDVLVAGDRESKVIVTADKRRLDQYGVSVTELMSALSVASLSSPIGAIETDEVRYVVRLDTEVKDPQAIASIPLRAVAGAPLYLRDVADVQFTLEEPQTYSRVSQEGSPSGAAVTLSVFKKTGGDITRIVDESKAAVEEIRSQEFPESEVITVFDNAKEIRKSISDLSGNGLQTVAMILLLLLVFLGWREALLAGITVPLTFLFGFIGLSAVGSTVNFLSLFSLILALGVVVDTGIVVVEGMHEEVKKGTQPKEAAKRVVREFQWPIISGTMTTVVAFFPMMFMSGIMGEFVKHIPITVNITLLGSLITGLALVPVVASKLLKAKDVADATPTIKHMYIDPYLNRLQAWYGKTIRAFLQSKRQKRRMTWFLIIGFVFSLALPATGILKATLFPENNADFFWIDIEAPIGTTLDATDRVARQVEEALYQDSRIESFYVNVGAGNSQSGSAAGNSANLASFTVNLKTEREEQTTDIINEYRSTLSSITEAEIVVSQAESGPPAGAPVAITFKGPELDVLETIVRDAQEILEDIEGAIDVGSSIDESVFEFVLTIDREKAAASGFTPFQIAQTLRTTVQGTKAATLRYEGDDVDVQVRQQLNPAATTPEERLVTTIDEILQLSLRTADGRDVPLSSFVTARPMPGTSAISHEDGDRVATATANVSGRATVDIFADFEKRAAEELVIPGSYTMKLGGEQEDIQQTFTDMIRALFTGMFLIAAVLLLQFGSLRQVSFIMLSLPMALIAVLPGLAIMGQTLSFPSFIGIIALSGVVVNDAIMLMDKINRNRQSGMVLDEAIADAGQSRLQPILLTTVTTVAGILPLTLSDPIWGPLGFAIIFGLSFATVLTLCVIPMLYQRWGEPKAKPAA